jgi:hypothetical protein
MAGRKRASTAMPKTHKKQKTSRSAEIIDQQTKERLTKGNNKQTKADGPVSVSAKTSPQDLGEPTPGITHVAHGAILHRHLTKVRATQPFLLDNTILFTSVRRLFVDSFKEQKTVEAISPDNLKKSAIHHFPTTVAYSSNVITAPGKSKRLAEKSAARRHPNIVSQEDEEADTEQTGNDPVSVEYDLPQTVLSYGTVKSMVMRCYVLEDVLQSEVSDDILFLVSPHHINYVAFLGIANMAPPLPIRYHRGVPFIQI